MTRPDSILITGASSGLGAALALAHARPGVHLALTGRDRARLTDVVDACLWSGATISDATLDVRDADALGAWIEQVDATAPLDLVIANAGISGGTGGGGEGGDQSRAILAVNIDGVVNTVLPAAAAMRRRGSGHIAIMSSLAAFRGFPGAPAYCASKAAVRIWGEALRGEWRRDGVAVTVICPGYVRTPMTEANDFPMPMIMDADDAAALIARRLVRRPARIAFPGPLYFGAWLVGALPPALTDPLLSRLPKKI